MDIEHVEYSAESVLVVDDEERFGIILEELLKHCGFNSHHVDSAAEALMELRKEKPYTFVITDINMPEMDGLELTGILKNDYPHICVIVMTGHSDDHKYVDVVNTGATDFINKPFRIEELEAKIKRAIIERNTRSALERLSITDSLTGLYNQRHFYSQMKNEIARAMRQKKQIGLMLLDLDDFKQYNDTYGHLAGDERLQTIGGIINSQIRQAVDSGYRYGGDEFAVILFDAGPDICKAVGERISRTYKEKCDGACVSIGYAAYSDGMTPESFVAAADKCLYECKKKNKHDSSSPCQNGSHTSMALTGILTQP